MLMRTRRLTMCQIVESQPGGGVLSAMEDDGRRAHRHIHHVFDWCWLPYARG